MTLVCMQKDRKRGSLEEVLNWQNGAKARALASNGAIVEVEFTIHSYNRDLDFWIFYDVTIEQPNNEDVHLTFIDSDEDKMLSLAEDIDCYYGLDIEAPIWVLYAGGEA